VRADSLAIAHCNFSINYNGDKHHPFGRGQILEALSLAYSTNIYDPSTKRQEMSKRKAEDDEWEDYAAAILDLYYRQGEPLAKVMEAMNRQGFTRTYVTLALPI
jgi:hypothetical protein